ncbi:DUF3105 domain-containing protein [Geodermatophilus ruber]|uniref:DUF3105 domain-containing protein n=1 Tax=Geodermatophilus ruber TaxID=504800 RepID=A0A1I4FJ92_9ACTN|nr:DUF3105 domain-containing protein [Geodermatophilus ruber]SFL16896.1 Protein of unknown function [Geodermatophilus ruber]
MTLRAGLRRPGVVLAAVATVLAVAAVAGCTGTVTGDPAPAPDAVTLENTRVADYAPGQPHVTGDVPYAERPPVGGPHDPAWADCTGTVYAAPIRPENAVHSLEHGAVWITYDPQLADAESVAALAAAVEGVPGLMLSPYPDLGVPVSLQAWNHALRLDAADDPRLRQFVELLTGNPETTPEPGAPCENARFLSETLPA